MLNYSGLYRHRLSWLLMVMKGISEKGKAVYNFLKSGVAKGLSSNAIITSLRDAGAATYARTDMLRDLRVIRGVSDDFKGLKFIRRDTLISERHYKTTRKVMDTRYKSVVMVEGVSKITGDEVERFITVSHNTLLQRGEIENAALIALDKADSPTRWERMFPVEAYVTALVGET
jgi:hypothetical protein